jgi:hypothetical protein
LRTSVPARRAGDKLPPTATHVQASSLVCTAHMVACSAAKVYNDKVRTQAARSGENKALRAPYLAMPAAPTVSPTDVASQLLCGNLRTRDAASASASSAAFAPMRPRLALSGAAWCGRKRSQMCGATHAWSSGRRL